MDDINISAKQVRVKAHDGDASILERRDARAKGVPLFTAHWHIFIPTLIIFFAYSIAWIFLAVTDRSDGSLARLFIVVVAIGVPLLAGHAFLRYQTIRVQVNEDNILCHPGWPKDAAIKVPLNVIDKVEIKRGLYGHIFNDGTIIIQLKTHSEIAIADLCDPPQVKAKIDHAVARFASKGLG